jgi:predicted O-methyltransferase YrrM
MTWMPDNRTPVHCVQLEEELDWLLAIYRELAPRHILEIGAHVGGTLWHFMQNAPKGSWFTEVSLNTAPHVSAWVAWANERGHGLEVLDADSTAETSVAWMQSQAPYDFAFIDGGHWWEYVSKDWANVRKMMRKGGVVAFHDITDHGGMPNERVDVPRLWKQIRNNKQLRTAEKIALPGVYCGIGVVYL